MRNNDIIKMLKVHEVDNGITDVWMSDIYYFIWLYNTVGMICFVCNNLLTYSLAENILPS